VETLVNEQKLEPSSSELGHNQVYDKKTISGNCGLVTFQNITIKENGEKFDRCNRISIF
jgi:hypothetical protein